MFWTTALVLLQPLTVVVAVTVRTQMHGSSSPGSDTSSIILDEVFAESRLKCATICAEIGCSSMLYTGFGSTKDDCYSTASVTAYAGKKNTTATGRTCQRWDSKSPQIHFTSSTRMPESSLTQAQNYCRSPDNYPEMWCYTTDKNLRWDLCDVWKCLPDEKNCRLYSKEGAVSAGPQPKYVYYTIE